MAQCQEMVLKMNGHLFTYTKTNVLLGIIEILDETFKLLNI